MTFDNFDGTFSFASDGLTADAQNDGLIDLGHHDSIAIPGVIASYLQAHL